MPNSTIDGPDLPHSLFYEAGGAHPWRSSDGIGLNLPLYASKPEMVVALEQIQKAKEVTAMQYQKPEIVQLGRATELILGDKFRAFEPGPPMGRLTPIDCELDD